MRTLSQLLPSFALSLELIRFDKPVGSLLLLWPSLTALWWAARGWPGLHLLVVFVLGVFLMRSAGCCINDIADHEFDRHVKRTATRPVTSGKISKQQALLLGAILALSAFALVLTTQLSAVLWSFVALAIAILYPYSKRFISIPQAILGIAFSFGIPMAYAAVQGRVGIEAWGLLFANAFWVLAYDTEYAMVDRDDDLKLNLKTSAITFGRYDVTIVMMCYGLHILSMVALGVMLKLNGFWWIAACIAALQALLHYFLIRKRERERCFLAFRLNHWIGFSFWLGSVLTFS